MTVLTVSQINAECCQVEYPIHHVCAGIPDETQMPFGEYLGWLDGNDYWIRDSSDVYKTKCISRFCADGYKLGVKQYYCGHGDCNIFGCNCDGGCRSNPNITEESLTNAFKVAFGFTEQAKHKVFWSTMELVHLEWNNPKQFLFGRSMQQNKTEFNFLQQFSQDKKGITNFQKWVISDPIRWPFGFI